MFHKKGRAKGWLAGFVAVLFLFSAFAAIILPTSEVFACKKKGSNHEKMIECANQDGVGSTPEEQSKYLQNFTQDGGSDNESAFAYVVRNAIMPGYINDVEKGTKGGKKTGKLETPLSQDRYICDENHPYNGTALYHNCAIPNAITSVMQALAVNLDPPGIMGGDIGSAEVSPLFRPSKFNDDGIPADPQSRKGVYTAFEVLGYDAKFTLYRGEWDDVRVSSSAVFLSNFSASDKFRLTVDAAFNTVTGAVEGAIDGVKKGWKEGRLFGAIGGFFGGLADGGVKGFARTLVETINLNIYRSWGWYRGPGYGSTLYGARELSAEEKSAVIEDSLIAYFKRHMPDPPEAPEDLAAVRALPEPDKITYCVSTDEDNKKTEREVKKAKDCKKDEESVTKKDWKKYESKLGDIKGSLEKYGFTCKATVKDEDDFNELQKCISNEYSKAEKDAVKDDWEEKLQEAQEEVSKSLNYMIFLAANPQYNAFAPYNQYVCLDENNRDLYDENGQGVRYFNPDGSVNKKCSQAMRPPVKGALFGDGYLAHQTKPGIDTRREAISTTFPLRGLLFDTPVLNLANMGLGTNETLVKFSNTAIKFSFSTVLSDIGADKAIVKMVESFRNSVFFPLVALGVSFSALLVVFRTVSSGETRRALIEMVQIVLVFALGVLLLNNPAKTFETIEKGPAVFENAVASALLAPTNESNDWCAVPNAGLFDSTSTQRSLMCQNWLSFVVTPWSYGQWGTSIDKLNSGKMPVSEDTAKLVGTGKVRLTSKKDINNWGLYQLDKTNRGTLSESGDDGTTATNMRAGDLYRIVDLQFGPDGGQGKYKRYSDHWAGAHGDKVMVGLTSIFASGFGLIVIASYSLAKIVITIVSGLMLTILPLMLFIGLFHGKGQMKLREYLGSIAGYMIQRFLLTFGLMVMLVMVFSVSAATDNYMMWLTVTIAMLGFFTMLRPYLMRIAMDFSGGSGGTGEKYSTFSALKSLTPSKARSAFNYAGAYAVGATGALAGSIAMKDWKNIPRNVREGGRVRSVSVFNKNRHGEGLSTPEEMLSTKRAVDRASGSWQESESEAHERRSKVVKALSDASKKDEQNESILRNRKALRRMGEKSKQVFSDGAELRLLAQKLKHGSRALQNKAWSFTKEQAEDFRALRGSTDFTDWEIAKAVGAEQEKEGKVARGKGRVVMRLPTLNENIEVSEEEKGAEREALLKQRSRLDRLILTQVDELVEEDKKKTPARARRDDHEED